MKEYRVREFNGRFTIEEKFKKTVYERILSTVRSARLPK